MSVFSALTAETWGFIVLLFVVFLGALPGLWRVARACWAEEKALERIDAEQTAVTGGAEARQEARARLQRADFIDTTAAGERIQLLAEMAAAQHLPDRDVLASLAAARLRAPLGLPRVISGVLVLIGLAATLLGLTGAVRGLQRFEVAAGQPAETVALSDRMAEQSRRVDALFDHIQTTLGGMQTAFVPALIGVSLTIILLFLIHRGQSRAGVLLRNLERSSDRILIPLFRPSGALGLDEAAAEARQAAQGLLRSADEAASSLRSSVVELTERLAVAAAEAAAAVARGAEAGSASVARVVETLEARSRTEVDARRQLIDEATERLAAAARGGSAVVQVALTDRESVLRTALAELDASAQQMAKSLGETEAVVAEARQRVTAAGDSVAAAAELEAALKKTLDGLSRRLDATDANAGRLADSSTLLMNVVEELRRDRAESARGTARWAEWLELDRGQRAQEARQVAEMLKRLDRLAQEAAERNRQVTEQVRTIQLTDHGAREQRAIETVEAILEAARDRDRALWDDVLQRLNTLAVARVAAPQAAGPLPEPPLGQPAPGPRQTVRAEAPVDALHVADASANGDSGPHPSAVRDVEPEVLESLPRRLWIFLNQPIRFRRR